MAVTAYAAKGDEERIRDAGAEGYVSKPISVMRFVEAVAALLEAAAERAEQEEPAGEEAGVPETNEAAEPEGEAAPEEAGSAQRHSGEGRNPPSDDGGEEELDPGSSPG
jgi:DNA-binding response OmpR family regulator